MEKTVKSTMVLALRNNFKINFACKNEVESVPIKEYCLASVTAQIQAASPKKEKHYNVPKDQFASSVQFLTGTDTTRSNTNFQDRSTLLKPTLDRANSSSFKSWLMPVEQAGGSASSATSPSDYFQPHETANSSIGNQINGMEKRLFMPPKWLEDANNKKKSGQQ